MKKTISCIIIGIVIIVGVGFVIYEHREKNNYKNFLSNSYQRSFYETVDYIDNVDKMLDKIRLAKQPSQSSVMFAEIWKQADLAHDNLSDLPYNHEIISNALKFLSQVSDFSYSMLNKTSSGTALEQDDWKKIEQLREYSSLLSSELNVSASQINLNGTINWDKISKDFSNNSSNNELLGSMTSVSKQFQQYPSLIYDGPFSEHIKAIEPRMTKDKEKITSEQGIEKVKEFLKSEEIENIKFIDETDSVIEHTIPVYSYEVILKDNKDPSIYINVTKYGGYILWMLNYGDIPYSDSNYLTSEQALNKAESFLNENGYENMKYSYYEINDESIVINFAPFENGIIMYPDLVKVKVSLIDGTIIGYEATGFITMHYQRKFNEPKLNAQSAKEYISKEMNIKSINMAVIPLDSKKEILCYEFKGTFDNQDYIIYINSNTGKQEKIMQLIVSENGVLSE